MPLYDIVDTWVSRQLDLKKRPIGQIAAGGSQLDIFVSSVDSGVFLCSLDFRTRYGN